MRLGIGWPVGSLLLVVAAVQALFALLFFIRSPIATGIWPLPETGEMTMMFLSSIFAAAAASTAWSVLWGERASLVGIALDYLVIFLPLTIFALLLEPALGGGPSTFALATLGGVLFGAWALWWAWRDPIRDARPTPRLVRISFGVFVVGLVVTGSALVSRVPDILPWPVTPELSVVCGVIFLGAAAYFAYGLARPRWSNAGGQLAGFLAYDVVLVLPFLLRLPDIPPKWAVGLWIYTSVVVYSGALAAYYLFLAPTTGLRAGSRSRLPGRVPVGDASVDR